AEALPKLEAALEAARAEGARKTEALALTRLGQTNLQLDRYAEGLRFIEQSLPVWEALGDRFQHAIAIHNYASAVWSLGDAVKALELYERALAIRKEIGDRAGEAYSLRGMSSCYWSMGEPADALDRARQALAIRVELKDPRGEADARNSLGLLYAVLGDAQRARAEFQQAYALAVKAGDEPTALNARGNLGWTAIGLGKFAEALPDLNAALAAFEKAGNRYAQAYVLHNLGNAYAGLKQPARAIECFERSLAIKKELGDRWGEAYTTHAMGETLGGAPGRALLEQALASRRALRDRTGLILTLGSLARLDRDAGDLAAAEREIREAIEAIETSRARLASQDFRASLLASKRDFYEFRTELLAKQGKVEAALESAEQSRGRLLLDRLGDALNGVREHADPKLVAQERAARRRVNTIADRLERLAAGPSKKAQETQLQAELDRAIAAARDAAEAVRSRRIAELEDPPLVSAKQMQGLLRAGETLLFYAPGREQTLLWIVTPQAVRMQTLPVKQAAIQAAVEQLLQRIAGKDPAWREPASALERLLGVSAVSGAKLIFAGDGVIESVPFAALPTCLQREVAYLPSVSALALRRAEPPRRGVERILAIADPVLGPRDPRMPAGAAASAIELPRLRFSRLEAEMLAKIRPDATILSLDFNASRDALLSNPARLREQTIVHLASHALVDPARPELSRLVLSAYNAQAKRIDDPAVRLHEIYQLDLRSARLVTLSACRTAQGSTLPGEGLVSLTRGFQYAGAASVLATLWDVDDRSTASWMEEFYTALLTRKQSVGAAMRSASAALRGKRAEWAHPYYWAGFVLQGEWR
ncbi:CHAT domain-containing protein, partial [Aetokthonos hydrillicola Thurmond2011]